MVPLDIMLARLTPAGYTRSIRGLALAGMLLSLTVSTYYLMREQTTKHVLKRFNYGENRIERLESVRPEWRSRVGSIALVRAFHSKNRDQMTVRIARYFAAGFFATGALFMLLDTRAAPLMLLGTFAALYYCNTPRAENTWYPWDVPALFLAAATLLLAVRRTAWPLAVTLVAAVAFKETLLLGALYFLFYREASLRWRVGWTAATFAGGLALRFAIERWVGGRGEHSSFLHVHGDPSREYRVVDNLRYLFSTDLNHVVWVHAGMWLLVFLIPTRDSVLQGFKLVALALYAGLLLAGSYNEFRIFLEALPGTLLLVQRLFEREAPAVPGRA